MTEHDTPSTARTEALRRSLAHNSGLANHRERDAFVEGAEWALAQVREGLEGSNITRVQTWSGGFPAISQADALAVVDRLEGKP